MTEKKSHAAEYEPGFVEIVRSTCLFLATKLGDIMDSLVIVGGLTPSLLVDQEALPTGSERHVGTTDLDVGLAVALLDDRRYSELAKRLRQADFEPDLAKSGNPTRQRWRSRASMAMVDFLIPPSLPDDKGGRLRNIEHDFAAIITPGLALAFEDRREILVQGITPEGASASRRIWVCGAGAFVVLKALAFDGRGLNKDAYDLYYVLQNYGASVKDVADRLIPLLRDENARKAVEILRRDFVAPDLVGPTRVAAFLRGDHDDEIQADTAGLVRQLLALCGEAAIVSADQVIGDHPNPPLATRSRPK